MGAGLSPYPFALAYHNWTIIGPWNMHVSSRPSNTHACGDSGYRTPRRRRINERNAAGETTLADKTF
jgi:hypothetical protein